MSKTNGRPVTPQQGYEAFVADVLEEAMLARDLPRVAEIGKLAAELVALEIEQARRSRAKDRGQGVQ